MQSMAMAHSAKCGLLIGLQIRQAIAELQDGGAAVSRTHRCQLTALMHAQRRERAGCNLWLSSSFQLSRVGARHAPYAVCKLLVITVSIRRHTGQSMLQRVVPTYILPCTRYAAVGHSMLQRVFPTYTLPCTRYAALNPGSPSLWRGGGGRGQEGAPAARARARPGWPGSPSSPARRLLVRPGTQPACPHAAQLSTRTPWLQHALPARLSVYAALPSHAHGQAGGAGSGRGRRA